MTPPEMDPRRALPSVDVLLGDERADLLTRRWGRSPVVDALRSILAAARLETAEAGVAPDPEALLRRVESHLEAEAARSLRRVLNGTGVILHTNLGRAPLARTAIDAVVGAAAGYSNLEYDLRAGRRGSRHDHCARLIRDLTGSEAALVVNNNAAAVVLAVNELAAGLDVIVSRGELIEIGGSFRLPEMVVRAGARLIEVGTTNRTRIGDYRAALGRRTGLLLKAHPSNFRIEGFVEEVSLAELVALGREHDLPVLHDLGSGLLDPSVLPDLPHGPTPRASISAGADLVCWSGDKLLGGPQAGILHGSAAIVERLRRNPLLRAFRVGKMTLAALETTLRLHRDPELAASAIPALAMLREPVESVERRARAALEATAPAGGSRPPVRVTRMTALVGGGAYPSVRIDSAGWAVGGPGASGARGAPDRSGSPDLSAAPGAASSDIDRPTPHEVGERCRRSDPPLIGRLEDGEFRVDCRTLLPDDIEPAARILWAAAGTEGP